MSLSLSLSLVRCAPESTTAAFIAIRMRAHDDLHPAKLGLHYARVSRDTLYKPSPLLPWKASLNPPFFAPVSFNVPFNSDPSNSFEPVVEFFFFFFNKFTFRDPYIFLLVASKFFSKKDSVQFDSNVFFHRFPFERLQWIGFWEIIPFSKGFSIFLENFSIGVSRS